VLALRLARAAGINAADAQLIDSEGSPVAVIRRFDRSETGDRLAYLSAATMIGADGDRSVQLAYTDIIDSIRQHGADVQVDIEELWRRIAFSILITNVDDHLHNHGFLHASHGQWRLAPAFDVNPFPERARELKTWISEEVGPEASIDALMSIIPYCNMDRAHALKTLADVERAVSRWHEQGQLIGMTMTELDQFADAFEHRERDIAQKISSSAR
jgi:serine/threonine-protein kinase HipA